MSDIEFNAVLPEGWPRPRGYAHGVVSRGTRSVRVAGQIGTTPGARLVAADADFPTQFRNALANVRAVVEAAGGEGVHIVSLRVYMTSIQDLEDHGPAVGAAWGELLGRHFPAMTVVGVSALIDPHALVEIEAEAVLP